MNQEFEAYIHEESSPSEKSQASRWNTPLVWTVLLVLGFLVYEITARPVYGITIVCAKFGWNYFRSALWLLRVDPNRQRAWACFWLCLAAALARTAATAGIIMLGLAFMTQILLPAVLQPQVKPNAGAQEFLQAAQTAVVGFGLSGLITMLALLQGFRRKVKLWLDPGVERARERKCWPPLIPAQSGANKIHWLLAITDICFFLLFYFSLIIAVFGAFGQKWTFVLIPPIVVIMFGIRKVLTRRVVASSPSECWGDGSSTAGWAESSRPITSQGLMVGLEDSAHPTSWPL